MGTITREFLSASSNGRFINITASGSPGTLIHTSTNAAGERDEVWLWGVNNTQVDAAVIIEWGGTDDVIDITTVGIPTIQGEQLLVAGRTLTGGLNIRAYSDTLSATASGINIGGHVNRINNV